MAVTTDLTIFATFNIRNDEGAADVIDARMVVVRNDAGEPIATAFGVCRNGRPMADHLGQPFDPQNATEAVAIAADRAGWPVIVDPAFA